MDPNKEVSEKLYVLVREDLSLGQQAVQALHAAVDYCVAYPQESYQWWVTSNTVVVLGVKNRNKLQKYRRMAERQGVSHVLFWEPDINQHTALAVRGDEWTAFMLSDLKLALRTKKRWWK